MDLTLVSVDSTTTRAHHDAAGMRLDPEVQDALEKAADEEKNHAKGAPKRNKSGKTLTAKPGGPSADASGGVASSA